MFAGVWWPLPDLKQIATSISISAFPISKDTHNPGWALPTVLCLCCESWWADSPPLHKSANLCPSKTSIKCYYPTFSPNFPSLCKHGQKGNTLVAEYYAFDNTNIFLIRWKKSTLSKVWKIAIGIYELKHVSMPDKGPIPSVVEKKEHSKGEHAGIFIKSKGCTCWAKQRWGNRKRLKVIQHRKVTAQKMPLTHSRAGEGGEGICYAVAWDKVK